MTQLTTRLSAMKERLAKATPGPWQIKPGEYVSFLGEQFFQVLNTLPDKDGDFTLISANRTSLENAEFIAHSRIDMELLIAALERAVGALEHITSCVERDDDHETANTSNFYRLKDARRTAERELADINRIFSDGERK